MKRRQFLQVFSGAAAAMPFTSARPAPDTIGARLPLRPLCESGISVTCLGLGGFHIGWTAESLAQATIEAALEEGVRFFDTAESYGPHTSEERYGKYLIPRHREEIFLMTKSTAKDAAAARLAIEGSLRRLGTDHIDLWQMHGLASVADTEARLKAGVLDEALKARAEGKIRHIGFTGHASPAALSRMLESSDGDQSPFLACQFPINPVDAGASESFVREVLPRLPVRNVSALAMKTLADGHFFAQKEQGDRITWETGNPIVPTTLSVADCVHFVLSLPVSVLITGAENPEYLREKARLVRSFHELNQAERQALVERVKAHAELDKVEYYKS